MKNLKSLLENTELKITPQRLAILKELENFGHATIEEIYENIKEIFPSISLATIYKNINALKEAGIICEICTPYKNKYEINKGEHGHFICAKCGNIEDFELTDEMIKSIENKYPNTKKEIYIYGVCENCNKN
ncbi:Fur family transcriptional regulator [Caminibacter mediatlanticus]|uniref:PEROXIDE STRESS REGULATOR n=1 Tax=Caminibacter mediatlanticus TB-2 TaxID=391592 RepID=A0AAI9AHV4_9BACT|nr:Fur family transcriptional regulator [Caminibacter mediatlanticus]EDM23890.1 PEROXIDE STRESS REGULATOR [Caminibacter mediatlanticus TB-2]